MARYADFKYGSRLYGNVPKAVSRSFILAQAIDYGAVLLTLDVEDRVGSGFVITRTRSGAAEDPSNGIIIASGVFASPSYTITDGVDNYEDDSAINDVEVPSGVVYYTLFIFDTSGSWFRDAATSLVVPQDRRTWFRMANNLPRAFSSTDGNPISPTDMTTTLMRFLGGFAVTYDEWATALDLVVPGDSRARGVIRRLHEAYASSVGMPVETTIGVAASSRLFRDSGLIYREKGTLSGIQKYVEALTNWDTTIIESPNKFLSVDDASFETSIGNWGATGGTVTRQAVNGGTVTAPDQQYEDPLAAFGKIAVGRVTLTSTEAVATLPSSGARGQCIPVSEGTTYYWKIPVRGTSGTPTVAPGIVWLDQSGTEVSTSTFTAEATTSDWSTVAVSDDAPTDAVFAQLTLTVSGSSGDQVDTDMMSFCDTDTHYREPRSVDVICGPSRINLLSDPSFEGSSYWTADSGTFTRDTTDVFLGSKSGLCEGTEFRVVSEDIPALPLYAITLGGYSKGSGTAEFQIEFVDSAGDVISAEVITASTGDEWGRSDATVLTPADTAALRLVLTGDGPVYFDALSLERSDRPLVYFDGSVSDQSGEDGKYAYIGDHVYSLLYPNRLVKLTRLRQTLPFYMALGTTARVLLWDSPDPDVQALLPYGA